MAEFTQTPYLDIIKIAFIPAVLYFFSVILFVHLEAQKAGIWGLPKEVLPQFFQNPSNGDSFYHSRRYFSDRSGHELQSHDGRFYRYFGPLCHRTHSKIFTHFISHSAQNP